MKKTFFTTAISAFLIALLIGLSGCDQTLETLPDSNEANRLQMETEALSGAASAVQGTDRFMVMAQNNNRLRQIASQAESLGGSVVHELGEIGVLVVEGTSDDFKEQVSGINGVRSVIPDLVYQFDLPEPGEAISIEQLDDPPFSGSADVFFDLQWGHNAVRAHYAWPENVRGEGARVAVLDGGFDLTHPDLIPNINFDLSMNFVQGEDLQYGLPNTFSHGAHVAGTIAAAQNDFGIIGVAPDAELVLVKVLGDGGSGSFGDVAAGIVYAGLAGSDVINMSLGAAIPQSGILGEITSAEVAELRVLMNRVVNFANQQGAVVITSAGNSALDRDKTADLLVLPADMPNTISISATGPIGWATDPGNINLDNLASYSNYGRSNIHFGAPGGDFIYPGNEDCTVAGLLRPCWVFDLVFSTGNAGWYWSAGTSMAAPHAAGIAALIISENGGSMHPSQVEAQMRQRADRLGTNGRSAEFGMGRVSSGY